MRKLEIISGEDFAEESGTPDNKPKITYEAIRRIFPMHTLLPRYEFYRLFREGKSRQHSGRSLKRGFYRQS